MKQSITTETYYAATFNYIITQLQLAHETLPKVNYHFEAPTVKQHLINAQRQLTQLLQEQ